MKKKIWEINQIKVNIKSNNPSKSKKKNVSKLYIGNLNLPSKHFLVLKTPWRHLQDMSWWRLQDVFSVTILRLPRRLVKTSWRRLEDVFKTTRKTSWRYVLEDEKLLRWRRLEDVLKTYLEDVLKTCFEDVLKTCLEDSWKH